jgi:precorrin-6Y C5,15-methyltransferase (decarboxylating)
MKSLWIIGTGMGPDTITREGFRALEEADLWFGAKRLLDLFQGAVGETKTRLPFYDAQGIMTELAVRSVRCAAVLVSGDTGFYSAAQELYRVLSQQQNYSVSLLPGISTVSAFFTRLGLSWQDCALFSAHGRDITALVALVRRHRRVFCLTGGNTKEIGVLLSDAGFSALTVHIGKNLGSKDECINTLSVGELRTLPAVSLSALVFENSAPDDRLRIGIPDEAFSRLESIPMTKAAVRAAVLSKLALRPGDTCYDIGAGTGSVSVEMALASHTGQVFAVEKNRNALALIHENRRKFKIANITVIEGQAPGVLSTLPQPDAVFIGGSDGNLEAIIQDVRAHNPAPRLVITAITIETVHQVFSCLPQVELLQLTAAVAKQAGPKHRLIAQNPVFIMSVPGSSE